MHHRQLTYTSIYRFLDLKQETASNITWFCCQGFAAVGTTISSRLNAYDHLLEETVTDPSKLRLDDFQQTKHSDLKNTTLLYSYPDDEEDEAEDDTSLEIDISSQVENYFCDTPSQLQHYNEMQWHSCYGQQIFYHVTLWTNPVLDFIVYIHLSVALAYCIETAKDIIKLFIYRTGCLIIQIL